MGIRFRKSFKIAPGVRATVGKKSGSVSLGGRGGRITASTTGRTTTSASVPGTGVGWTSSGGGGKNRQSAPPPDSSSPPSGSSSRSGCGCLGFIALIVVVIVVAVSCSSSSARKKAAEPGAGSSPLVVTRTVPSVIDKSTSGLVRVVPGAGAVLTTTTTFGHTSHQVSVTLTATSTNGGTHGFALHDVVVTLVSSDGSTLGCSDSDLRREPSVGRGEFTVERPCVALPEDVVRVVYTDS
ncbi:DUF4236 domain-containing protein [Aestuariimicrobium sp. T2.26MG-19.2B]|uniref:DUF4236 domain-containing protein n=1 Tax=Aestuariimicrobium sp. T2.26MG-19.2B TaxID=3040679 RepID=UPI0024779DA4|nr:DUF4236 domain-containing protein [Aestuariimicrobium sp. T2.26MG-19.2B]CAI9400440.1 hypothetical protein AESSP_00388 [Aestuariimicrobium sp. T2.26MG-19.2B]